MFDVHPRSRLYRRQATSASTCLARARANINVAMGLAASIRQHLETRLDRQRAMLTSIHNVRENARQETRNARDVALSLYQSSTPEPSIQPRSFDSSMSFSSNFGIVHGYIPSLMAILEDLRNLSNSDEIVENHRWSLPPCRMADYNFEMANVREGMHVLPNHQESLSFKSERRMPKYAGIPTLTSGGPLNYPLQDEPVLYNPIPPLPKYSRYSRFSTMRNSAHSRRSRRLHVSTRLSSPHICLEELDSRWVIDPRGRYSVRSARQMGLRQQSKIKQDISLRRTFDVMPETHAEAPLVDRRSLDLLLTSDVDSSPDSGSSANVYANRSGLFTRRHPELNRNSEPRGIQRRQIITHQRVDSMLNGSSDDMNQPLHLCSQARTYHNPNVSHLQTSLSVLERAHMPNPVRQLEIEDATENAAAITYQHALNTILPPDMFRRNSNIYTLLEDEGYRSIWSMNSATASAQSKSICGTQTYPPTAEVAYSPYEDSQKDSVENGSEHHEPLTNAQKMCSNNGLRGGLPLNDSEALSNTSGPGTRPEIGPLLKAIDADISEVLDDMEKLSQKDGLEPSDRSEDRPVREGRYQQVWDDSGWQNQQGLRQPSDINSMQMRKSAVRPKSTANRIRPVSSIASSKGTGLCGEDKLYWIPYGDKRRPNSAWTSSHSQPFSDYFITSRGNEYFCEIDEEYLTDRFNLTGLQADFAHYQNSLDLITDVFDVECDDATREAIEKQARHLYGLVHARYIITTRGLQKMVDKYKKGEFGKCPRVACETQHLLPMGQHDNANISPVKLYCPHCEDIYSPKSSKHAMIDGAYFGTSFHSILFQVYPTMQPPKTAKRYEPKIYGFRVHAPAALARWQLEQIEDMKVRLQAEDIETGFEAEDGEDDISGEDDGAADNIDDMVRKSLRIG